MLLGGFAPAEPPPAAAFLPAWRGHAVLRPPGHAAPLCTACGRCFRERRDVGTLEGVLATRAVAALLSGRFDAALATAPTWQRERAAHAGG